MTTAIPKYEAIELSPADARLAMFDNGYEPIPVWEKKKPVHTGWPEMQITSDIIRDWRGMGPHTGLRTKYMPVFDIDIKDGVAAAIVENVVRSFLDGRGEILVRIGESPKRAIPLRTDTPFEKDWIKLVAPNGSPHKIELLCDGQQMVAAGIHPDTNRPYFWQGGRSPVTVLHQELPLISEADAKALLEECGRALSEIGWKVDPVRTTTDEVVIPFEPLEERLKKTEYKGAHGINQAILDIPLIRLSDGVPIEDIIKECMEVVRLTWSKIPNDHPDKAGWDWNAQRCQIESSVYGAFKIKVNECPRIVDTLPKRFLKKWREIEERGGSPHLVKRKFWGVEDSGPAEPPPDMDPPKEKAKPRSRHKPANVLVPFKAINAANLPPRAWLYGQHYLRGVVTVTAGMGGRGKSSNSLVEAIVMATGRDLLGEAPTERCRVWYHCGDDNMEELLRRVAAICQRYKIDMEELEGWLFLTTPREFELRVAEGYMDVKTDEATINRIHEQIEANEIDAAILDPLVKLHGVNESGTGMDRVLGIFQAVADEHGCSIEIVHHTRKNGVGHADAMQGEDDMRGSTAIHGAVRSQRMVNVMPSTDAAELQIPESERRRYIRISTEKPNYAPSGMSNWYKLISVTIANGDNVGVVEPWQHPREGGAPTPEMLAAEKKADGLFLEILDGYQGATSSSKTSQHYAPKVLAKQALAKAAGVGAIALAAAMERLLANGRVVVGTEKTGYGAREKLMRGGF
jgi:hypothetical protein